MYCNDTNIVQSQIQLGDSIYTCGEMSVEVSCTKDLDDVIDTNIDECFDGTLKCQQLEGDNRTIYCTNATLLSRVSIVCNSTTTRSWKTSNETTTVLNCYEGELPQALAGFIPTTTAAPAKKKKKELSMGAKVHIFLLHLLGQGEVLETTTVEAEPRSLGHENEIAWIPEALTMPPETITLEVSTEGALEVSSKKNMMETSTDKNESEDLMIEWEESQQTFE